MLTLRVTVLLLGLTFALASGSGTSMAAPPSPEDIQKALATQLPTDPAEKVAVVGQNYIFVGDLMPRVEQRISEISAQSGKPLSDVEVKYLKVRMFRSLLSQQIQLKMLRESFLLKQVATQTADKRRDAELKLQSKAREMFFNTELPKMYKKFNVNTLDEVDAALREQGSSFESAKLDFIDQMLAYLYQSDQVKKDPEISLTEIQVYYQDHHSDFEFPARVRWEQLTATFEKSGSRQAALELINEMGREAFYGGSFQSVAKKKSQEPFASRGGVHNWTIRGSLASITIEDKLYSLPLNEMSEVIEDESGFHIVRVLERENAGVRSLPEVQDEIRDAIKKRKVQEASERVVESMRKRVPVWTIFPEDVEGSLQLAQSPAATDFK